MRMKALTKKNLWEATPPVLKRTVGRVLGLIPPATLLGARFREMQRFVADADRWSAEQAREYQLTQLRRIVTLAHEKCPYYQRTFRDVGFAPGDLKSLSDLSRLPFIHKDIIREHAEDLATQPLGGSGMDYVSTGGSSGAPLRFYIDANRSATEFAYLTAGWERIGYQLTTPQAVFRGQEVTPDRDGLRHLYDPVLRRHYYSNFHMNDAAMERYVDHLRTLGTCFLHVYPSSITMLTRFLKRTKQSPPGNVKGILAGSENVLPDERQLVEAFWQVPYHTWYGHSEKLVLAAECEHATDYHVWPTYGYCELIDEQGQPCRQPGQRGEIVGTGFINTVMPFIRYRTGDYATYVGERCDACGREQMLIKQIEGRQSSGAIVASDGALVSPTALNVHDDTFEGVLQYQFYQDTIGEVTIRIVPAGDFSDPDRERILTRLNGQFAGRVKLTMELCDTIPLTHRGKAVWIVQKLDIDDLQHPE